MAALIPPNKTAKIKIILSFIIFIWLTKNRETNKKPNKPVPATSVLKIPSLSVKKPLTGKMKILGITIAVITELSSKTEPVLFIIKETCRTLYSWLIRNKRIQALKKIITLTDKNCDFFFISLLPFPIN